MCVCVCLCISYVFHDFPLMVIFFATVQTRNGWINCCPPEPFTKENKVFFLFSFRLKNISSFTTRSLVEQLLQFLFVFFHVPAWNCIVFCRNYSVFFFFFSIFTIYGGGRKFRTISSLFVWFAHSLTCIHANTFEIDWFPSHLPYAKLPTARFLTFLLFYLRTLCVFVWL